MEGNMLDAAVRPTPSGVVAVLLPEMIYAQPVRSAELYVRGYARQGWLLIRCLPQSFLCRLSVNTAK